MARKKKPAPVEAFTFYSVNIGWIDGQRQRMLFGSEDEALSFLSAVLVEHPYANLTVIERTAVKNAILEIESAHITQEVATHGIENGGNGGTEVGEESVSQH